MAIRKRQRIASSEWRIGNFVAFICCRLINRHSLLTNRRRFAIRQSLFAIRCHFANRHSLFAIRCRFAIRYSLIAVVLVGAP